MIKLLTFWSFFYDKNYTTMTSIMRNIRKQILIKKYFYI